MDPLNKQRRSNNMAKIRDRDTKPEIAVRRIVTRLGYRYRLHVASLPGKPDLVFRKKKSVVFVHGCFWHQHSRCREGRIPGSRQHYWLPKLMRNVERDSLHRRELNRLGWRVLVIWECDLKTPDRVEKRLARFLGG